MTGPQRFCIRCGRALKDDETECPQCGGTDGRASSDVQVRVVYGNPSRLNWATVLLLLYGIIAAVEGFAVMFFADDLIQYVETFTNSDIQMLMGSDGMTRGEVIRMITIEGGISFFSGMFATAAGVMCVRRIYVTAVLGLTLSASVLILTELVFYPKVDLFMLLIQFLLGIFVFRLVYMSKDFFRE